MQISFHGAAGSVTGSCYLLESAGKKFVVDCGMFQGSKALKEFNYQDFAFDPTELDFAIVTHAHIDHTGLLPKLVKHGFKGAIFATAPTADLLRFLLPDSAHIQESECERKNRKNDRRGLPLIEPIYTAADAEKTLNLIKGISRGVPFHPCEGITATFQNAGHVLGSAFLILTMKEGSEERTVVFSGDLGEKDHPIVEDPETFAKADVLLIESTYGDRIRDITTKEDRLQELARIFNETKERGGNLIIPSFALERTQDLMHDLATLMDRKVIPEADITIDSPLAIKLTNVFDRYKDAYDEDAREIMASQGSLFSHPRFKFTLKAEESMALNDVRGAVILSASGMCDAGRIKHHLKHNLWKPENTVLFVGYQANGTLGRIIMEGAEKVRIHGEEVAVEAHIEQITGYSGHADQKGLLEWLDAVEDIRDRVFVIHGEDDARATFAKLIQERRGFRTVIPQKGEVYDLLEKQAIVELPEVEMAPVVDAHNLYADVMLRLATYMRKGVTESERMAVLKKVLDAVPE